MLRGYASILKECALKYNPAAVDRRQHDVEERFVIDTFHGLSLIPLGQPKLS